MSKKIYLIAFLTLSFASSFFINELAKETEAAQPCNADVCIYENDSYNLNVAGSYLELNYASAPDSTNHGYPSLKNYSCTQSTTCNHGDTGWDDELSSIIVKDGYRAILYEDINYTGSPGPYTIDANSGDAGQHFSPNDHISSIKIVIVPVSSLTITGPVNKTVTAPNPATFNVNVSGGAQPYHYQWKKNGSNFTCKIADSPECKIDPTSTADNGTKYKVVVTDNSNPQKTATSAEVTLTVTSSPIAPSIQLQPEDTTAAPGQSAFFSVAADDHGSPPLSYQWRRKATNGSITNVGSNSQTYNTPANLTVANDNNTYFSVVVTNAGGSVTSRWALLKVTTDCSGSVAMGINPANGPSPTTSTVSVSGLANCDGKTASFVRDGSCGSPAAATCTISGQGCSSTVTSTSTPGGNAVISYVACVDKDNDSFFTPDEQRSRAFTFTCANGMTPPACTSSGGGGPQCPSGKVGTPPNCCDSGFHYDSSAEKCVEDPLPSAGPQPPQSYTNPTAISSIEEAIGSLTFWLYVFAVPLLSLMILYGAFLIMTSGGEEERYSTGMRTIRWGVIGFLVILLAGAIAAFVRSVLG